MLVTQLPSHQLWFHRRRSEYNAPYYSVDYFIVGRAQPIGRDEPAAFFTYPMGKLYPPTKPLLIIKFGFIEHLYLNRTGSLGRDNVSRHKKGARHRNCVSTPNYCVS
jgi:hypothetical protein